jgi:hypothetical protein
MIGDVEWFGLRLIASRYTVLPNLQGWTARSGLKLYVSSLTLEPDP